MCIDISSHTQHIYSDRFVVWHKISDFDSANRHFFAYVVSYLIVYKEKKLEFAFRLQNEWQY